MDEFIKATERKEVEEAFSFRNFFVPLTTVKAIHWIVIIGVIVFANSLFNGFVWDDKTYVLSISQTIGLHIIKLFGQNIITLSGYYRPIGLFYFSVLYSIFGQTPFYYHLPQIILHIVNTVLVFLLFASFFRKNIAFFLSLIFLVHPIQTESVIYIAPTDGILFFFFGILTLVITNNKQTYRLWIITGILIFLALLTKESAIVFILLLLIFRILFNKGKVVLYGLISLCAMSVYFFIRFFIFHVYFYHITFIPMARVSFVDRLLNIPAITWYYLKTFFYPTHLIIDQQWVITQFNFQTLYLPLFIDCAFFFLVIFFSIYLLKHKSTLFRVYLFFVLWFGIGLGIYEQIIPLDMTVANRWFYVPIVGLIGMIGIAIETFLLKTKTSKKTVYIVLILIIVLLSARTMVRNTDWQNALILYEHDSMLTSSYDLEGNLGEELYLAGYKDKALYHYKKSVNLLPFDRTLNNIGVIYEREGKYQLAKQYYLKAINAVDPMPPYHHDVTLYQNVSRMLIYFGNPEDAVTYLNQGLKIYPHDYVLLLLKGMDEYKLQETEKAKLSLQKSYSLAPNDAAKKVILQFMNDPTQQIPLQDF
ncbi:MAG TPA: tetratricopeptide repeat protein [Candidatus Acidoferrales bacterium]|nr:tetratricopeptide repeat protein [Candidatus Acidoferrales bacterium]